MRVPAAVLLLLAGCAASPAHSMQATLAIAAPVQDAAPGTFAMAVPLAGIDGVLVRPDAPVHALVVVLHGYGGDAHSMRPILDALAAKGVAAVAVDGRGAREAWKASALADDSVAAALWARQAVGATRVVAYGISMGGEAAALAVRRAPPGTFDELVSGDGVADLEALWAELPVLRAPIEAAAGGNPHEVPDAYADLSPATWPELVAASGVRHVWLVHAPGDTIVPAEQAQRWYDGLRRTTVPSTYLSPLTKSDAYVCAPLVLVCGGVVPAGPANHEAGWDAYIVDLVARQALADGRQGDPVTSQHLLVDETTGRTYETPEDA